MKNKKCNGEVSARHGETDKIISELNSDRWLWKGMKYTNLM